MLDIDGSSCECRSISISQVMTYLRWTHTRNGQLVQGHMRQAWISDTVLVPPSQNVAHILRIRAEVPVEFITQVGGLRWSKCQKVIEDVGLLRGQLQA